MLCGKALEEAKILGKIPRRGPGLRLAGGHGDGETKTLETEPTASAHGKQ